MSEYCYLYELQPCQLSQKMQCIEPTTMNCYDTFRRMICFVIDERICLYKHRRITN